jgi:large subunit ribosomal protein L30
LSAVQIKQVRSAAGTNPSQKATLSALGLGRIGKSRIHSDTPDVRGQIQKVPHLVSVETLSAEEGD